MIRVINNTDLAVARLLVLYKPELDTVKHLNIESIVFDDCRMMVFGIDCILLEIDETPKISIESTDPEMKAFLTDIFK
jgi:hypothetical protein